MSSRAKITSILAFVLLVAGSALVFIHFQHSTPPDLGGVVEVTPPASATWRPTPAHPPGAGPVTPSKGGQAVPPPSPPHSDDDDLQDPDDQDGDTDDG